MESQSAAFSRRATLNDSQDTGASDDNDENETATHHLLNGNQEQQPTQYEQMRDGDFSHLGHEEEDDQYCSQKLRSRMEVPSVLSENRVAENGIIESITCMNFMCHEKLTIELGPLLNFIVGENGSGKSAVLTAITICLGGKASATNRAGNLKALIKEGQETCRLVIVIKNAGEGAFRPDSFGTKIIIERQFSRHGNSSFRMKSEHGSVISTKKADIDEMTEYFGLQVDNPLNVLSQDNAREFLNAATPGVKYKFWVQGVNLQALDIDYHCVNDIAIRCESQYEEFKKTIVLLARKREETERMRQSVEQARQLKEQGKLLRAKLMWVQVAEQERLLEDVRKEAEDNEQRISDCEKGLETHDRNYAHTTEQFRAAEQANQKLEEEVTELNNKLASAQELYNQKNSIAEKLHADERTAFVRLGMLQQRVSKKKKAIEQEEARRTAVSGGALVAKQREKEEVRVALEETREEKARTQASSRELDTKCEESKSGVQQLEWKLKQKREDITACNARLASLRKGQNDIFGRFRCKRHRELIEAISRDPGFKQRPVGPIGIHTRLTESKWANLVDTFLGDRLESYVVTSHADNTKLRRLMRRLDIDVPIVTVSNQHLDTTGKEPAENVSTILRVLEFDEELCRTVLVLHGNIEQIALFADRQEAERFVMLDDGSMPRNVKACLAFRNTRTSAGIRIINTASGAETAPLAGGKENRVFRLVISNQHQVTLEKESLKGLEAEVSELESQNKFIKEEFQKLINQKKSYQDHILLLDSRIRNLNATELKLDEAISQLEDDNTEVDELKKELAELREEYELKGREVAEITMTKETAREEVDKAKEILNDLGQEEEQFGKRFNDINNRISRLDSAVKTALQSKNRAHDELEAVRLRAQEIQEKIQAQAQAVDEFTTDVLKEVPDRVYISDDETFDKLSKKYNDIKARLKERERRQGKSDDDIVEAALQAKMDHETALQQLANCESDLHELKRTLFNRLDKWRSFQRAISAYTRCSFEYLLAERQFRGRVHLDHKAKKLVIQVEPDEARQDAHGRNTKTLSGGEKSYSSICLLLSIWEAMGSPLRCLDEFDVFMDNVNRAISTKMLITAARRSVGRQYIFITPNAIEGAQRQLGDDVKITRLTDPRQKRLPDMLSGR